MKMGRGKVGNQYFSVCAIKEDDELVNNGNNAAGIVDENDVPNVVDNLEINAGDHAEVENADDISDPEFAADKLKAVSQPRALA